MKLNKEFLIFFYFNRICYLYLRKNKLMWMSINIFKSCTRTPKSGKILWKGQGKVREFWKVEVLAILYLQPTNYFSSDCQKMIIEHWCLEHSYIDRNSKRIKYTITTEFAWLVIHIQIEWNFSSLAKEVIFFIYFIKLHWQCSLTRLLFSLTKFVLC